MGTLTGNARVLIERHATEAAERAGIHVGRRPSLTREQTAEARKMLAEGRVARQVARLLKTSGSSLYTALRRCPSESETGR